MSYYAAPLYVGLSCTLSLIYSCIECVKEKGTIDTATKSILSVWLLVSAIVASVIAGVTAEMTTGIATTTHIMIALILGCATLSISSAILYWS